MFNELIEKSKARGECATATLNRIKFFIGTGQEAGRVVSVGTHKGFNSFHAEQFNKTEKIEIKPYKDEYDILERDGLSASEKIKLFKFARTHDIL